MTEKRWHELWVRLAKTSPPPALFQELAGAHRAPARAYHNEAHVDDCLSLLDEYRHLAEQPDEVELAVWFHDAIYDPTRMDNEQRSSDWAAQSLTSKFISEAVVARVRSLILATRHTSDPETIDQRLMVDIDLAILGASTERFDAYDQAIREEYAWVPESTYREKRRQVLIGFLNRTNLYHLSPLRDRFEKQARENLSRAIGRIESF